MKRKNIVFYNAVLCFLFAICSCSKQLEKHPYDQIDLSQSFKSVKDAGQWDNGIYGDLRGRMYGEYTYISDVQGDELNASVDFGNNVGGTHRWDWTSGDYGIADIWGGYYAGITNANIMIDGFKNIVPSTDEESDELKQYTGDAYFIRAYYYSQLVLRWAKPYDPSKASTDPGVPIVLTYDINNFPARSSVADVYTQILKDLDSASSLLKDVSGESGSHIFTSDAVLALQARVKLYMQDWSGAKTAADKLIKSDVYKLYTNEKDLLSMWVDDEGGEDIMQINTAAPNELAPTNSIYLGYVITTNTYAPLFLPSQWIVDYFSSNDIRRNVYFSKLPVSFSTAGKNDSAYLVNKYRGNPDLFTSASTNYEQAPKVFRIAEDYLISAEASYNMNSTDDARGTLNLLRIARGLPEISATGEALYDSIKVERTRELAFEGFRIDDLKRWHEPMTRKDPQNTIFLTSGNGYYTLSVPADNDKFVWGLPSNDVIVNKKLEQNPGW